MRAKIKVIENMDCEIDRMYQENGYRPLYMIGPKGKMPLTKKSWRELVEKVTVSIVANQDVKKSD